METLASAESASPDTEPELHLLLERDQKDDWHRWRSAAVISLGYHVVLVIVLLLIKESPVEEQVFRNPPVVHLTPIFIPTDITQKAPNKEKVAKEFSLPTIPDRKVQAPVPAPAAKKSPPPPPAPLPPTQVPKNEPKPVIAEAPKIELPKSDSDTQGVQLTQLAPPPPPPAQPPKLAFENVNPPQGSTRPGRAGRGLALPSPSVDSAIRDLNTSNGLTGGSQAVVTPDLDLGMNLPASVGSRAQIEIRSNTQGVDFRPYLTQVVAAVRRNWFAVYPEAARLGQRGEVIIEFAIEKRGGVTKVVLSSQSGAKALDQAGVAAISASNPFPPLPTDFKGDRVVLALTFKYNMPR